MLTVKDSTAEDLYNEFISLAEKEKLFDVIEDKTKLLEFLTYESNDGAKGFFYAPASTKYHGNYSGGLYEHSRQVYLRLKELTENNKLIWSRPQSPFIVGMFHDMCKCDQYSKAYEETEYIVDGKKLCPFDKFHYEYDQKTILKGHGSKSVILLSQFINLTEEEMLCIRFHMGPYEQDDWDSYDKAIRKYETVLWTNHADMLASKRDGV